MKRNLSTLVGLLASMVMAAAPVSQDAARQKALQFLSERGSGMAAARGMNPVKLQLKDGPAADQLYVFNVGQKDGFVIVSGDDCTGDLVLGYAAKGEISAEAMPVNLKSWLQGYADQIQWMKEHGVTNRPVAEARGSLRKSKSAIPAMLTTKWNQNGPYNNYCPDMYLDGSEKSVTGCVATATSQLMYYQAKKHNIDATTTSAIIPTYNSKRYYWYFNGVGYTAMPAKPIRTIDWTKIDATLTTAAARDEVARLMEYVGAAVKMDYGRAVDGSEASNESVTTALAKYFGYDADAKSIYAEDYSYNDWVDAIYAELSTNGPVLFGGQSSTGGHSFVIDGYDRDDFFYVNWGWGGTSDGSFKLSVMNPPVQGTGGSEGGYKFNQTAMVNVSPVADGSDLQADARLTVDVCNTIAVSGTKYNGNFYILDGNKLYALPFNYSLMNKSGWNLSFEWALGLYQGSTLVKTQNESNQVFDNRVISKGYYGLYFSGTGLPDGEYRLVYVSRKKGTSTWHECEGSEQNYIKVVVSGDNITFTNMPANIRVIAGNGEKSTLPTASSIVTPATAAVLDLSSVSGVTSVTPNSNPNTLYIVGSEVPAGLENCNVVKNGVAQTLALLDGHSFYSPSMFYAVNATYTRQFSVGANGTGGWSTIILPFRVKTVKQGDRIIDWFRSSSDTGKQFWLRSFSSDAEDKVNFVHADKLAPFVPYIIAVPGSNWGAEYDLTNKDITFEGETRAQIYPSFMNSSQYQHYYIFKGTTTNEEVTGYVLNANGSKFAKTTTTLEPFRAYFVSRLDVPYGDVLAIGSDDGEVTGIGAVLANGEEKTRNREVYNLNGQRVDQPAKGLYIIDGKKVLVK